MQDDNELIDWLLKRYENPEEDEDEKEYYTLAEDIEYFYDKEGCSVHSTDRRLTADNVMELRLLELDPDARDGKTFVRITTLGKTVIQRGGYTKYLESEEAKKNAASRQTNRISVVGYVVTILVAAIPIYFQYGKIEDLERVISKQTKQIHVQDSIFFFDKKEIEKAKRQLDSLATELSNRPTKKDLPNIMPAPYLPPFNGDTTKKIKEFKKE